MERKKESGKLFDGIEEIIANVVLEDGVHIVKLKSTEKTNLYEVIGNTAVKTDEPLLETQLLEGMTVRVDLEQANQLIERYKEEIKKAWDRADMYKQKYEDSEYEKDCMREDYEDIIRAKDEEITKLKAQLEWVKENPQNVNNYIQGSQYNMGSTHKPTQLAKEIKEEAEDVGVQMGDMKEEEKGNDEIQICKYILVEKAKDNTTYGLGCKPEDDQKRVDGYNRALLHAFNKGGRKLQILQQGEQVGYLDFNNDGITEIYNHFVEILGYQPYTLSAFYKACKKLNWQPAIKIEPSSSKKFQ